MRKPWEVLELAISTLDEFSDSCYMCNHLEWLFLEERITMDECENAKHVVRASIDYRNTLRGYLVDKGVIPWHIVSCAAEYRPYQVKFYTDLVIKLKEGETV